MYDIFELELPPSHTTSKFVENQGLSQQNQRQIIIFFSVFLLYRYWNCNSDNWLFYQLSVECELKSFHNRIPDHHTFKRSEVNQLITDFTQILIQTAKSEIGEVIHVPTNKPWYNPKLHKLRKRLNKARKKFRRTRTTEALENLQKLQREYNKKLKATKKLYYRRRTNKINKAWSDLTTKKMFHNYKTI